jgi:hypothetical protein
MENHTFEFVLLGLNILVIIISGLVGLIVNGLKTTIKEIKTCLDTMVTEKVCAAKMEGAEKDINNIGELVRNHSH